MNDSWFDWSTYLSIFHADRPGVAEEILSRAFSGPHTPYRWLARAVSKTPRTVLDVGCGAGAVGREAERLHGGGIEDGAEDLAPGRDPLAVEQDGGDSAHVRATRGGSGWVQSTPRPGGRGRALA